jgi:hypothetical protein
MIITTTFHPHQGTSNFHLLLRKKHGETIQREAELIHHQEDYRSGPHIIEVRDLASPERFRLWCLERGNWHWLGGAQDLEKFLFPAPVDPTPPAIVTNGILLDDPSYWLGQITAIANGVPPQRFLTRKKNRRTTQIYETPAPDTRTEERAKIKAFNQMRLTLKRMHSYFFRQPK